MPSPCTCVFVNYDVADSSGDLHVLGGSDPGYDAWLTSPPLFVVIIATVHTLSVCRASLPKRSPVSNPSVAGENRRNNNKPTTPRLGDAFHFA